MKILVINAGSSSLKYQLINMNDESVLAKGNVERIGLAEPLLKHTPQGRSPIEIHGDYKDHVAAIKKVIETLIHEDYGVIGSMDEIKAVGHRVVHGGERFSSSVLIDDEVMKAIEANIELAPLHNPANIMGINACRNVMPNTPMVAVFDTAFHQTMPRHAYIYALPYEIYEKYGLRRYGFHGTSHKYVSERAAKMLNKPIEELKIVSCHLGNGASICAVKYGKSIETSMGFTPLQGLCMGTRSGTIDPAVISFLMEKEKMTVKDISDFLNKKSGVLGVSGVSSDFRDIQEAAESGNDRAKLALDIFCYRVKRFIGDYIAIMNGVDAVVFTAGIGENNDYVRREVLTDMDFLGIKIDQEKNKTRGEEVDISAEDAKVRTLIIPTNEELAIARETVELVKKQ